jgi:hypothetical protein
MHTEWDGLFSTADFRKVNTIPDSPLESLEFQSQPKSARLTKTVAEVMKAALLHDIVGDDLPGQKAEVTPEPLESDCISAALNGFFAKGIGGNELKRKMRKGLGISEGMTALLTKFEEFFDIHEQRIMKGKIACLDVPGFLEMLNCKLA